MAEEIEKAKEHLGRARSILGEGFDNKLDEIGETLGDIKEKYLKAVNSAWERRPLAKPSGGLLFNSYVIAAEIFQDLGYDPINSKDATNYIYENRFKTRIDALDRNDEKENVLRQELWDKLRKKYPTDTDWYHRLFNAGLMERRPGKTFVKTFDYRFTEDGMLFIADILDGMKSVH